MFWKGTIGLHSLIYTATGLGFMLFPDQFSKPFLPDLSVERTIPAQDSLIYAIRIVGSLFLSNGIFCLKALYDPLLFEAALKSCSLFHYCMLFTELNRYLGNSSLSKSKFGNIYLHLGFLLVLAFKDRRLQ
jgi:hypothetical protein